MKNISYLAVTSLLLWPAAGDWQFRSRPDLAPDFVKPYLVDDKTVNQAFELKHGKSTKVFNMDKVSNSCFTEVCYFMVILNVF